MKKRILISLIVLSSIFVYAISLNQPKSTDLIIGAKIYNKPADLVLLFKKFNDAGINTVFASVDLLSNESFKEKAQINHINTYVILPIFYDPEALKKDSSLWSITQYGKSAEEEWVKFVCPSAENFKRRKIEFITEFVKTHNPTGISLDFIRHFVFWEKVYQGSEFETLPNTCFDKRCISKFLSDNNLNLPEGVSTENEIYKWIKENCFEKWIKWKCHVITEYVSDVAKTVKAINPGIKINLHAVPWRENDFNGAITKIVGQDFESIAKIVDYISPMTYSHMLKREPEWIHAVVEDIDKKSNVKIIPSIQVQRAYLKDILTVAEFGNCLKEALRSPSSGVIFWNWKSLESSAEKFEVVIQRVKSLNN